MTSPTSQQQQNIITKAPHPRFKNIVFDLGAVLIRFNPKELLEHVFKNDPEIPYELMEAVHHPLWADIDRGVLSTDQVIDNLSAHYDREKLTRFVQDIPPHLTPLQDGIEILKTVRTRGYKTYVLSNLSEICYDAIKHHDFLKEFDGWIFSYQHKCAKPDQEIYQKLLSIYNLEAHECLFIDDIPRNIDGARAMGIDGIVCKDHNYVKEQLKKLQILD